MNWEAPSVLRRGSSHIDILITSDMPAPALVVTLAALYLETVNAYSLLLGMPLP